MLEDHALIANPVQQTTCKEECTEAFLVTYHSIHSGFAQPLRGVLSHPTCQLLYLLSCRAKDKFMNWALKLVLSGRARGVGHSILAPTETGKTEPSSAVVVSSKAGSADSTEPDIIPVSGKLLENLE